MRKPKKKRTSVNLRALTAKAGELVKAEQTVSYKFLGSKLKVTGIGTISKILKRLEVQGLVRRGKGRQWMVIVNQDGTAKPNAEVPEKRRFKKRKVKRSRAPAVATAPSTVTAPVHANGSATPSVEEKIALLNTLAQVAGSEKAAVLESIVGDLKVLDGNRKIIEALS